MTRIIHCPKCRVELTIPEQAGSKRLRCPKCAERFYPIQSAASKAKSTAAEPSKKTKKVPSNAPPPAKKSEVTPPSGQQSSRPRPIEPKPPTTLPELREMLDIPLLDDDLPVFARKSPGVADAATLFGDEPITEKRKKPAAEAKREARKCPSCGRVVLQGMSLCDNCGLDLDTGRRYEVVVEESYEPPQFATDAGPPASIILIGILALAASGCLAVLAILQLSGLGLILLTPVCLFGVFSAVQFLRGKSLPMMILSLMLAGGVDLVVMIVLPIVMAEEEAIPEGVEVKGVESPKQPSDGPLEVSGDVQVKPLTERIDSTKITLGVVFIILDAVMLIAISTPGVKQYFEKPHHDYDDGMIGL